MPPVSDQRFELVGTDALPGERARIALCLRTLLVEEEPDIVRVGRIETAEPGFELAGIHLVGAIEKLLEPLPLGAAEGGDLLDAAQRFEARPVFRARGARACRIPVERFTVGHGGDQRFEIGFTLHGPSHP
jgi:hypothetical protein